LFRFGQGRKSPLAFPWSGLPSLMNGIGCFKQVEYTILFEENQS